MNKYIYGGYVECGGNYNGRDWQNYNILIAEVRGKDALPVNAKVYKAAHTANMAEALRTIAPNPAVTVSCDMSGRITAISPV